MPYTSPNPDAVRYIVYSSPSVRALCSGAYRVYGTYVTFAMRSDFFSSLRQSACVLEYGCACTLVSELWWQTMRNGGSGH